MFAINFFFRNRVDGIQEQHNNISKEIYNSKHYNPLSVALSSLLCFLLEHILNCTHSLNHGLVKLYSYKFFNHLLMSSQVHLTIFKVGIIKNVD